MGAPVMPACPLTAEAHVQAMIDKRRARWAEREGAGHTAQIEYDRRLREAAARHLIEHRELMQAVIEKPWMLVELAFTVIDKKGRERPFFLNAAQRVVVWELEAEIAEARAAGRSPRPINILKGRQQGVTSLVTGIQEARAITTRNFYGMTVADTAPNAREIFKSRAKVMYDRLPTVLKPHEKYNSKMELFFDRLNSSWLADVATKDMSRGRTLSMIHYSEVATYKCLLSDVQAAVEQGCTFDAWIFYESTANGFNQFREIWEGGRCRNVFLAWWLQEEYRQKDQSIIERACAKDAWLTERVEWLRGQGLCEEQIAWYCQKYDGFADKSKMRQEYPCFAEEAFVFSGTSLFNAEAVSRRLAEALTIHPIRVGAFVYKSVCEPIYDRHGDKVGERWRLADVAFEERVDGIIKLHAEPRVEYLDRERERVRGYAPYALGGDTAGDGEDYYTAKVVDAITLKTAATLRVQKTDDRLYAEQILCLAQYYHMAEIAVEINFSPSVMRIIVQMYDYPNIYMRERFDKITQELVEEPGFRTDRSTKPVIIGELQADLRADPDCECDPETLEEMLTFVRHPNRTMGAVDGAHDDLVMALAIAHHAAGQGQRHLHKTRPTWEGYLADAARQAGQNENIYAYPDEAPVDGAPDGRGAAGTAYQPYKLYDGPYEQDRDTVGGGVYGGWEEY